ncbi:DEAD/DEAH box helicase [Gilvimarinus sp. F26214L]|uniref:DEAD/DEAH box helicase n=1 Tax=Gilvimarinus sp. DZF01 TaxID=3461371 RepID=UPI0040454564
MTIPETPAPAIEFAELGLPESLLQTVKQLGYETPSPIQAQSIPVLLQGKDLLGQAQTGTGKTAAFALPLLANLNLKDRRTQALVLAPTRELAIQVAEACQSYARNLPGFHVVPIYGGAGYSLQLKHLRSGAQLVVGTPGRVMDHIRKGTLKLDSLQTLVLDEADEMLRMGFIDDVQWILEHTPAQRQIALFSATMPKEIQQVANRHLRDPELIKIASKTTTATAIRQRYWPVAGLHKLDALTRILEVEETEGAIIFVRTKVATVELAEKLVARGFAAEALNGDMAQAQREKTIDRMRQGKLDILVATDVAARGIDIPRISHVINYDIPFDTEAYVHRIGRTGRAGRKGEAILFVANRERRMLKAIERATRQPIEVMNLPSEKDINEQRVLRFKQQIQSTLEQNQLDVYRQLVLELQEESETPAIEIAAALAKLLQGDGELLLREDKVRREPRRESDRERAPAEDRFAAQGKQKKKRESLQDHRAKPLKDFPDVKMQRFRLAVGYADGVRPGHIVGAIANEAELESRYIGHIEIFDDFSTVDLPADMPRETFQHLKKVWVCQKMLNIRRMDDRGEGGARPSRPGKPARNEGNKKPGPRKSFEKKKRSKA